MTTNENSTDSKPGVGQRSQTTVELAAIWADLYADYTRVQPEGVGLEEVLLDQFTWYVEKREAVLHADILMLQKGLARCRQKAERAYALLAADDKNGTSHD